jgi:2-aminoadipate transaminase
LALVDAADGADAVRVLTSLAPRPPLSQAAARVPSSAIRDLLALTGSSDVLSLAGGLPALGHVHDPVLATAAARVVDDAEAVQYGTTEGWPPLRRWIARRLSNGSGGVAAAADDVRVTHGSQQAIDLVVRALVDPGDVVVVERPTYLGAVQALAPAAARVHAVPVDADGLDTHLLADALRAGLRPRLCYLAPTFQNPSGVVMSAERRAHLAELASHHGFVVVDDDPYRDLAFSPPPPPLRAWLDPELSVTLGTFSKVLAPGLRVGWVHGPPWLVAALTRLKQATDLHTSTVAQRIVAEVVTPPDWLDGRIGRLVALHRHRAAVLTGALRDRLDGRLHLADARGGMFLWGRLDDDLGLDADALLPGALARGVAFVPGAAFACDDAPSSHLRLCFATLDDDRLTEAAHRLAGAVADAARAGPGAR